MCIFLIISEAENLTFGRHSFPSVKCLCLTHLFFLFIFKKILFKLILRTSHMDTNLFPGICVAHSFSHFVVCLTLYILTESKLSIISFLI